MRITFEKAAAKYMQKTDVNTRKKLQRHIEMGAIGQGDVRPLLDIKKQGHTTKNVWRIKIEHYRIFFEKTPDGGINVLDIATKSDSTFRKYGYM